MKQFCAVRPSICCKVSRITLLRIVRHSTRLLQNGDLAFDKYVLFLLSQSHIFLQEHFLFTVDRIF